MMELRIAVLVGEGQNPVSGRSRRAPLDASAVELALQLSERLPFVELEIVHAGAPDAAFLNDYLGMGAQQVTVLEVAADHDPIPALLQHLQQSSPNLILCGDRAEDSYGSGMLPYMLSEQLHLPIISSVESLLEIGDSLTLRQALERGERKLLSVSMPCVLTVGFAGPPARLPAMGASRGREINRVRGCWRAEPETSSGVPVPASAIIKQIESIDPNASAADRLAAITNITSGSGDIRNCGPDEAAKLILSELKKVQGRN